MVVGVPRRSHCCSKPFLTGSVKAGSFNCLCRFVHDCRSSPRAMNKALIMTACTKCRFWSLFSTVYAPICIRHSDLHLRLTLSTSTSSTRPSSPCFPLLGVIRGPIPFPRRDSSPVNILDSCFDSSRRFSRHVNRPNKHACTKHRHWTETAVP